MKLLGPLVGGDAGKKIKSVVEEKHSGGGKGRQGFLKVMSGRQARVKTSKKGFLRGSQTTEGEGSRNLKD